MTTTVQEVARDLTEAYGRKLVRAEGAEPFDPNELGRRLGGIYTNILNGIRTRAPGSEDDTLGDAARIAVSLAMETVSKLTREAMPSVDNAAAWLTSLYASVETEVRSAIEHCPGTPPYQSGAFRVAGDFLQQCSADDMAKPPHDPKVLGGWVGGLFRGVLEGFREANEKHSPSAEAADAAWGVAMAALPRRGGFASLDKSSGEAASRWVVGLYASTLAATTSPPKPS